MIATPDVQYGRQADGTVQHYPRAYEGAYRASRAIVEATGDPEALRVHDAKWCSFFKKPIGQYRPLPAARAFHQSQAQHRVITGGNRSSKSYALAREVFWYATGLHPWRRVEIPNISWYSTVTHETVGKILWETFAPLLAEYKEGKDYHVSWRNRSRLIPAQLDLFVTDSEGKPGVSTVIFKSYEEGPRVFQGTARRLIAFDEQFEEGIWLESVSRIGTEAPLDMIMGFTPIYSQPWLEEKLQSPGPRMEVFCSPIDDNRIRRGGFFPDEEIDALIDDWPVEVQPTRRLGEWGSFLGAVYKTFSRSTHVVPVEREGEFFPAGHPTPDMQVVGGIDWGGANPFVFLWACKLPHLDNAWFFFDELYWTNTSGTRLLKDHAEAIKERTRKWRCGLSRVWADHDPTDAREMASCGVASRPAKKDVNMGIEAVQRAMKVHDYGHRKQPHFFVSARCENTIRELSAYRWSSSTKNRDPAETPVKKDDHSADVVRYVCFSEEHSAPTGKRISLGSENRRTVV